MNLSKIYLTNTTNLNKNGQRPVNLTFDCVIDYSPVFKRAISTYPISTKSNFADHIFQENTTLKLVAMVTATPLSAPDEQNTIDSEVGLARVQKAYTELQRLHKQAEPLVLVSEFDVLNNLYLTEVVPVQDNNAIMFTLSFEQQIFAPYRKVVLVKSALQAAAASTNDGTGGKKSPEWGYKYGQQKEKTVTGVRVLSPDMSLWEQLTTSTGNVRSIAKDSFNKLISDPASLK